MVNVYQQVGNKIQIRTQWAMDHVAGRLAPLGLCLTRAPLFTSCHLILFCIFFFCREGLCEATIYLKEVTQINSQ